MTGNPSSTGLKPICVVIDTNIWWKHPLLAGPAEAVIHAIRRLNGRLALPVVIEEEVKKHTVKRGLAAADAIKGNLRTIQAITGAVPSYDGPTTSELEQAADTRIAAWGDILLRPPFTNAQALAALRRVNAGLPPNGDKNQQFKDSAVWETILELAETYAVHFVTDDRDFYRAKDKLPDLAPNLRQECESRHAEVYVYQSIDDLVKALGESAPLYDVAAITEAIDLEVRRQLPGIQAGLQIDKGPLNDNPIRAYATDQPGRLALYFEFDYHVTDLSSSDSGCVPIANLNVRGEALYEIGRATVADIGLKNIGGTNIDGRSVWGWNAGFTIATEPGEKTGNLVMLNDGTFVPERLGRHW